MFLKNRTASPKFLVVGLGNIGNKYENTRHNIGFRAIDEIAKKLVEEPFKARFNALVAVVDLGGESVLLMKPTTFMNLSGKAVGEAASFYKIPADKIIVFSDDTSIPLGSVRIRAAGSHGGHNGLKDITNVLGTDGYCRVRIGVGEKPHPDYDLADWVLGKFSTAENKELSTVLAKAEDIVAEIIKNGVASAQNSFGRTVRQKGNTIG